MLKLASLIAGPVLAAAIDHDRARAATETAGSVLAKLNKLPPEQRQKTLVEKARAEAEVSFYSSL